MFNGNLNSENQGKTLSPFLLALSILIDGEVNIEEKCSQAVLTLSDMSTYNTRKLKKSNHTLNHRHHKTERETPVTMYVDIISLSCHEQVCLSMFKCVCFEIIFNSEI